MKRWSLLCVLLLTAAAFGQGQGNWAFKGTVIRMKMGACGITHGFMVAMAGVPAAAPNCPEYTIMSDKVVYVVAGTRHDVFMPLAENMDFVIRRNELVTFSTDEKNRSRFTIQAMTLRAEWDREEARKELQSRYMERSVNYEVRNPPRASVLPAAPAPVTAQK
jgi:hypothetical protein